MKITVITIFVLMSNLLSAQDKIFNVQSPSHTFRVVGYYSGPTHLVDRFEIDKLTHLIFSFGHLDGNRLKIANATDTATIRRMVSLRDETNKSKIKNSKSKIQNHIPIAIGTKILLSLGGWGGCATCSDVFNTQTGREEFAQSVKELTRYFNTDGIDLDWEYPSIQGHPGHTFRKEDRENFTELLKEIRRVNGKDFEISFAAGGFTEYINDAVEWKEVIKYTDFINIMTYDLVHGYSKTSGHHTPLYSTPQQTESTDHAVAMLLETGVPAEQIVIGAAFYGRYFEIEEGNTVDLYQPCRFSHGFSNMHREDSLANFEIKWDSTAQAPYAISEERKLVATYDDEISIRLKTQYAIHHKLGGIMFWQLIDDKFRDGLLHTMHHASKGNKDH